jgi:hypothetical protein
VLWWTFLASREKAFNGPKQATGENASMSLRNKRFRLEVVCSFEEKTPHFGTSCNVQSTAPSRFSLAHPLSANHLSHGNDGRHHGRVRVPHGDEHIVVEEKMIWQIVDREDHWLQRSVLVARLDRCQGEDVGRLMDVILPIWRPVSHVHDR